MSTPSVKTPAPPKDPDPEPQVISANAGEVQQVKQEARKKIAGQYGRQKTILAGQNEQQKKTILGG